MTARRTDVSAVKCQIEVRPETEHVTRWVLMPCTFEPHHCAPFTLTAHVIDQGSATITQLREISTADLRTITVKVSATPPLQRGR